MIGTTQPIDNPILMSPEAMRPAGERALRATVVAFAALGLAARLAALFDWNGRLLEQFPGDEAWVGLTVARNLALGRGLTLADGAIPAVPAQPLATLVWSACFSIVGGARKTGVLLVLVAELLLGAACALGVWELGQRALAGTRQAGLAALLAAAVWWASPVAIPHAMDALETGLTTALVILCALAFVAPGTERAWSFERQLRFGLALGAASLARLDAAFLTLWACLIHVARPIEGRGAAPLRRLGEALVFGAVAAVLTAPWLVWSDVSLRALAPPVAHVAESLSRVPAVFVGLALLVAPIPRALAESVPGAAAAMLACALGLITVVAASWRVDSQRRALLGLATLFALSLAAFHGLRPHGVDLLERELFPVSPFLAIGWGWAAVALVARREARLRAVLARGALVGAVALAVAGNLQRYRSAAEGTPIPVVRWVETNVPDDVWVGARRAGALGFFHDRTVSLDGASADRVVKKQLSFIVGPADAVDFLRDPRLAARYELLVHDPGRDVAVLHLKPPAPPKPPEEEAPDDDAESKADE